MANLNIDKAKIEQICTKYQIDFLGVFGSAARGDDRPDSDVDLLVRFSPRAKVSYFKLFDIEQSLNSGFGKKVDLITQDALSPYIKDQVYSDLQTIYGQP